MRAYRTLIIIVAALSALAVAACDRSDLDKAAASPGASVSPRLA